MRRGAREASHYSPGQGGTCAEVCVLVPAMWICTPTDGVRLAGSSCVKMSFHTLFGAFSRWGGRREGNRGGGSRGEMPLVVVRGKGRVGFPMERNEPWSIAGGGSQTARKMHVDVGGHTSGICPEKVPEGFGSGVSGLGVKNICVKVTDD